MPDAYHTQVCWRLTAACQPGKRHPRKKKPKRSGTQGEQDVRAAEDWQRDQQEGDKGDAKPHAGKNGKRFGPPVACGHEPAPQSSNLGCRGRRVRERVAGRRDGGGVAEGGLVPREGAAEAVGVPGMLVAHEVEDRGGGLVALGLEVEVGHERVVGQVRVGVVAAGDLGDAARVVGGVAGARQQDRLLPEPDADEDCGQDDKGDRDADDHPTEDAHGGW